MRPPTHILITGASSGIGAALAILYAAPGIYLSLHGRNKERLALIATECRRRGAVIIMHVGDITAVDDTAAWINKCDNTQPLDLVIANAGLSGGTAQGSESTEQVNAIFAVNITGVLNTVQPILPLMRQRQHGQIAIMSSLASFRGLAGTPAYCASKAAVRIYGEGLRAEMAPYNVQVNIICPGFIKTPMTDVNPFAMPFLMSANQAAEKIRSGLLHNVGRISFPWQMSMLAYLLATLPQPLVDMITQRLPKK